MASQDPERPDLRKNPPRSDRPEYKVHRSRPGLLRRLRGGKLEDLRETRSRVRAKATERPPGDHPGPPVPPPADPGSRKRPLGGGRWRFSGRRLARWILGLALLWILISLASFAVSAQLQTFKLAGSARDALDSSGPILASPQNILVIGTDARSPDTLEPGAATSPECYEQQAHGDVPSPGCVGTARADTLLVVRAGGGQFRQLSIPRDSYAEIPGNGTQKINGAYAYGGAALQIETVSNFLDLDIHHVIILDFGGFAELIDALGGIEVEVPRRTCGDISGGKANGGWTIRLRRGKNTLNGEEALAYARLRKPSPCPGPGRSAYAFGYSDFDRARAQQSLISGIKARLTSPLRLPYNFIKGPWIGWAAPKAFVTDMGALSLPQLLLSTLIAGTGDSNVLCGVQPTPCVPGPGGSIEVPVSERQRAVRQLTGN